MERYVVRSWYVNESVICAGAVAELAEFELALLELTQRPFPSRLQPAAKLTYGPNTKRICGEDRAPY